MMNMEMEVKDNDKNTFMLTMKQREEFARIMCIPRASFRKHINEDGL